MEARYRVGLVNDSPVMLLLEAERRSLEKVLTISPRQSDYAILWKSKQAEGNCAVDNPVPHRFVE